MHDNTAITSPSGEINAVDCHEIDDTRADLLAQAVGQMIDGAEHEATDTLRELASDLNGQGLLSECSEDLAHAYDLMKAAIAQLASARRLYEDVKGAPLRENAAIRVVIRRLKAAHPEWEHIEKPKDALDAAEDGQNE